MSHQKRRWTWILTIAFSICMLMGTGPGLLLVNRPVSFLGLPLLYVWGLAWYCAQVTIIVAAYFAVWRRDRRL